MPRRKLTVLITLLSLSFVLSGCGLIDIILADPIRARLDAACAAAPFEVTKTEDTYDALCTTDDCSLREAVFTANECEGAQEIHLEDEVYELTRMDPGDYEDPNAAGGLVFTESATIIGNGGIVDGQDSVRVFDLRLEEADRVVFQNLTIQNGFSDGPGGGIRVMRAALELQDTVVSGNTVGSADGTPASGGGIFVREGSLSLVASEVRGNRAYGQGGGIFFDRGTRFGIDSDSVIADNRALDDYGGGGIYTRGEGNLSGDVDGNQAAWAGGGVHNAGELTIRNANITNNRSETGGGGVSNSGELEIRDSAFLANNADDGGGLMSYQDPRSGGSARASLVDVSFGANGAERAGGGVFNGPDSLLIGTRVTLDRNEARWGAGFNNLGEAVLIGAQIEGNLADTLGGGGLNEGGLVMTRSMLTENEAGDSTGGGVANRGSLDLMETTVANNVGSGLWSSGVTFVELSTIEGNRLDSDVGGAGVFAAAGQTHLLNSTVSGNEATTDTARTVFNLEATLRLVHVTLFDNRGGGAILESVYGTTRLVNSIVLGDADTTCFGNVRSDGSNLLSDESCSPVASDVILDSGDPLGILPLADYGGLTETHALEEGSPALDAVTGGICSSRDQRKEPRPAGDACDIGSIEGTGTAVVDEDMTPTPLAAEIDVNFNADLYTIERGECTTLRWQVSGASRIQLLGQEVEDTGAEQVCPSDTTGYTLMAQNDADEVSEYLEIAVTEPTDDLDLSCWHQPDDANMPTCYEVCPVDNPDPGGSCTP